MRLADLSKEDVALGALASFVDRYPDPALVLLPSRAGAPGGPIMHDLAETDQIGLEGFGYEYGMPLPRPPLIVDEKAEPYGASEIVFLRTAARRTTARHRILVGRGIPNHVVLSNSSVSFVHAWVEPTAEGWTVTDAGSSNGTFVEGEFLRVGIPAKLTNGARLSFGLEAHARFFLPDGLHRYLALYREKTGLG